LARPKDPALRAKRRQEIGAATFELLAAEPFSALTLDRVAEVAGVSKGLVSYHFGKKDELIVTAIRRYHETQAAILEAIVASDEPIQDRLDGLITAAFLSRDDVVKEVRFQAEVWSFAKTNDDALEAIAGSYRRFRAACCALLRRGIDRKEIRLRDGNADASEVYLVIHALIDGLTFQVAVDPSLDLDVVRTRIRRTIESMIEVVTPSASG
jgi:AcrR family transcriptional regulator